MVHIFLRPIPLPYSEQLAADLWLAVDTKNLQHVESLLKQGANPNHTMFWDEEDKKWDLEKLPPLHRACKSAFDVKIVGALVDGGADLERGDKVHNMTPLHWACETDYMWPHQPVVEYLAKHPKCNLGEYSLAIPIQTNKRQLLIMTFIIALSINLDINFFLAILGLQAKKDITKINFQLTIGSIHVKSTQKMYDSFRFP